MAENKGITIGLIGGMMDGGFSIVAEALPIGSVHIVKVYPEMEFSYRIGTLPENGVQLASYIEVREHG